MPIDILFLGGTSIDLIQDTQGRPCQPRFTASIGGSATNTCVIAGKLGLRTALLSRIGKDPLGESAIRSLNSCGISTKGVIQDPSIRTPLAVANIDRHGNSVYTFYKNAPKKSIVPFKMAPKNLLNQCRIFHFGSSFSYRKETHLEALKYVRFLKKRVFFSPLTQI